MHFNFHLLYKTCCKNVLSQIVKCFHQCMYAYDVVNEYTCKNTLVLNSLLLSNIMHTLNTNTQFGIIRLCTCFELFVELNFLEIV